jgi:hypothetical protein
MSDDIKNSRMKAFCCYNIVTLVCVGFSIYLQVIINEKGFDYKYLKSIGDEWSNEAIIDVEVISSKSSCYTGYRSAYSYFPGLYKEIKHTSDDSSPTYSYKSTFKAF